MCASASAAQMWDSGDPTNDEQAVLEMINRARANPTAEGQRLGIDITEGLQNPSWVRPRPPLAMNRRLLASARGHSQDMYTRVFFDHVNPSNQTPWDRITAAGYVYTLAGENIAGGSSASAALLEDLLMVDAGVAGRGHRVNLLSIANDDNIFREVGIGYFQGTTPNADGMKDLLTQNFGASSDGPFVVGVVYNDANGNGIYDAGEGLAGVTVTPDTGTYGATTTASGGYAFPVSAAGSLNVTATGGGLAAPITQPVSISTGNVKLDFVSGGTGGGGTGGGGTGGAGTGGGGTGGTAPTFTSTTTAGGTVGAAFGFTLSATGTIPITYSSQNLPPGLVIQGTTIVGTPTTAGDYLVTITATNSGGSANTTMTIKIGGSGGFSNGGGSVEYVSNSWKDSDGDGVADELEVALGTSPGSANSSPLAPGVTTQSLILSRLRVKLNFLDTVNGKDQITLQGLLPIPAGFSASGKKVTLDVGGVIRTFTLDARGNNTPKGKDSFRVRLTPNATGAYNARYQIKLNKAVFSTTLADEGLVGTETVTAVYRPVPVLMLFNETLYAVDQPELYWARQQLSGYAK
jgi:uncharacterized protein YkwD